MNMKFQKTLIAIAVSALFGSAAIAADDYSNTIDGDTPRSENQRMDRSIDRSNTHEQQFNETIDGNPSAAGNRSTQSDRDSQNQRMDRSTDRSNTQEQEFNETIDGNPPAAGDKSMKSNRDMNKPCKDDVQHRDSTNRPMSDHQSNVIEEEEEEEVSRSMTDRDNTDRNQQMDETPYGATGAGTPAQQGGLFSMSADDLTGMDVVTSDGEDVGSVKNIVISPDNQNIHAVVNVGGLLGIGASTILIPLEDFTHKDDELHVNATEAELEAMTDYGSDDFVTLEGDAALSTALRPRNN